MRTRNILTLTVCLLLTSSLASAAKKTNTKSSTAKDSLKTTEGTIDKKFQPVLEPVERILVLPEAEPQTTTKQPMTFSIAESPASLQSEYTPLPAAGIMQEFPAASQRGYVRLGLGSHRSYVGDAQLNLLRKPTQTFDINFRHRSIFGDLLLNDGQTTANAYNADNNLLLTYKVHRASTDLDINLGERATFWNYYGRWSNTGTLTMDDGQWSTDGYFHVGLQSSNLESPYSYNIKATGHLFRLGKGIQNGTDPAKPRGGTERDFTIEGRVNYKVDEVFSLGMNAKIRNFGYKAPTSWPIREEVAYPSIALENAFEDRRHLDLAPFVNMNYKNWLLSAGLKLSIPSLPQEKVRPNIVASAMTPLNDKSMLRLTLDGGVKALSYREGIEMNRYLDPSIRLESYWKPIDLAFAIDYRPSANFRVSPEMGFNTTKDAPFFYNTGAGVDNAKGKVFSVEYMNSTQIHLGVNGQYTYDNFMTLFGSLAYDFYQNSSETDSIDAKLEKNGRKAWYKPGLIINLRAEVNPVEKLTLFADYRMEGLRYAATPNGFCEQLEVLNDLSLGANYNVVKGVGIFLHVNNLLDQRYEEYAAYPVHGFSALLGGSVSF
jgi:hypothetical protein